MAKDPASNRERVKAYKLRKQRDKGEQLTEEDEAWLAGYEERAAQSKARAAHATERVSHVEERTMGVAEGGASIGDAMVAREDGRRVDILLETSLKAMQTACEMYHRMTADLLARSADHEKAQMEMLQLVREHYLGRIEVEGRMLAEEAGASLQQDPTEQLIESLLPHLVKRLQDSAKAKS